MSLVAGSHPGIGVGDSNVTGEMVLGELDECVSGSLRTNPIRVNEAAGAILCIVSRRAPTIAEIACLKLLHNVVRCEL